MAHSMYQSAWVKVQILDLTRFLQQICSIKRPSDSWPRVRFLADKFIWFSLSLFVNTEASLAHTNTLKLSIILLHLVQKKENQPTSQDLTKGKREKIVRRDLKMSRKPTAAGIKSEIRYPHIWIVTALVSQNDLQNVLSDIAVRWSLFIPRVVQRPFPQILESRLILMHPGFLLSNHEGVGYLVSLTRSKALGKK